MTRSDSWDQGAKDDGAAEEDLLVFSDTGFEPDAAAASEK